MIPLMSKKRIDIIFILDFDIRVFFGLGIQNKLFLTPLHRFTWRFLQFNTKTHNSLFHHTLQFHVWTKLTTHSDVTSYCSMNTERSLPRLSIRALSCCVTWHSK
jgi:hypothetical protein